MKLIEVCIELHQSKGEEGEQRSRKHSKQETAIPEIYHQHNLGYPCRICTAARSYCQPAISISRFN
ncbi:hypothetical protein LC609_26840 [Nostoc sp. XA013]|nr:hypothetical protein [Nostoc sp. XA013]